MNEQASARAILLCSLSCLAVQLWAA